jgi:hypothetical protein
MTDEERQRTMDFILQQMAQFAASIQRSEEERQKRERTDRHRDVSIAQIRRILAGAIWEFRRSRRDLDGRMAALVDSQMRTEDAIRSLTATTESLAAATERNSNAIAALSGKGGVNAEDAGNGGGGTP